MKGQSGNPKGAPIQPERVKALKIYTKEAILESINSYMGMTKSQISERINDPQTPMIDLLIGTILAKAVANGDPHRFDALLNRVIGRVKDETDIKLTADITEIFYKATWQGIESKE